MRETYNAGPPPVRRLGARREPSCPRRGATPLRRPGRWPRSRRAYHPPMLLPATNRKQQCEADVETFRFKEAKLDGNDGGKIRSRDKIGNGDPYHSFSGPGRGALRQLCVLNELNRWNELNCSNRSKCSNCFK